MKTSEVTPMSAWLNAHGRKIAYATVSLLVTLNGIYDVVGPKTATAVIVWLMAIGLYENSQKK